MSDPDIESSNEDDDLLSSLAAEFDKAETVETPAEPQIEQPSAEPEQPGSRARDDKGRFAPKGEEKPEPKAEKPAAIAPKDTEKAAGEPAVPVQSDATAPSGPPPGWSPSAKVAFNELPADHPIRQAVAQREAEINKGFAKLAEFKPIERFSDMAKQGGTTLEAALTAYTSIENQLKQDFQGGILQLCQRNGINPVQLANSILSRHGGQSPQQDGSGTTQARQQAPGVDLSPVMQKISALENFIQQQQSQGVQTEIQKFASNPKNVFFENVKLDMGRLINSGQAESLDNAYDKACWANKEIRELLIKQQNTAAPDLSAKANAATQARAAARSITGSPIPNAASKGPETSIEDEIRQAFEAALV